MIERLTRVCARQTRRGTAVGGFLVVGSLSKTSVAMAAGARTQLCNLIAAGFVDTSLSASLLGDDLDKRRDELRATLPIRRVVGPADVAALAVHIMSNTALTGATYDIDGGQQFV